MTDPNAEAPRPAVDPWADMASPEAWDAPESPAPPTVPDPHYPTPTTIPDSRYRPGHAGVPATPAYSATEVYPPGPAYPAYPPAGGYAVPPPPRGGGRVAAILAGVLVLILVGVGVFLLPKLLPNRNGATGPNGGSSSAPNRNNPTTPAQTTPPPDIFAGTPAENFQAGSDAIAPPAPQAVTGFSVSDVGADLTMVKQAMTAARLNPKMLVDHDATSFINLLAPDGRQTVQDYFDQDNAFPYATRLEYGTNLSSDPIRAKGTWTVTGQTVDNHPAVVIETNYIWVYPVVANRSGAGADLIVVRDKITWVVYASEGLEQTSVGLWVKHAYAFGSNLDCNLVKQEDLVSLPATSISETRTEDGDAYNLDADFNHAYFIC
jgi:hypothetical protein